MTLKVTDVGEVDGQVLTVLPGARVEPILLLSESSLSMSAESAGGQQSSGGQESQREVRRFSRRSGKSAEGQESQQEVRRFSRRPEKVLAHHDAGL